jgi:hypothetical protein
MPGDVSLKHFQMSGFAAIGNRRPYPKAFGEILITGAAC